MPDDAIQERLRLDYAQTTALLHDLTDVRFKLLAFVPTVTGAAVAVLSRSPTAAELLAVGVLGLAATLGIVAYELRNVRIGEYALRRAQLLEGGLGLRSAFDDATPGGLFRELPRRGRLADRVELGNDGGLALVYSAAIAGWSYLVAWGALRALDVHDAQQLGLAAGAVAGIACLARFVRGDLGAGAATTATAAAPVALGVHSDSR